MAEKIKGITVEFGADTTAFSKALNSMKKDARAAEKELKYVDKALKLDPKNPELISQKFSLLSKEIEQTESNLKELKAAQENADKAIENGAEIDEKMYRRLQREIAETEDKLKSLRKEGNQASYYLKEIGSSLTEVGKKGMGVTAAIGGVGAASVVAASQFENAFAKTLTIADTNEVAADDLKKAITDLSNETGIASAEIADNVYNAISAGQKTADSVNFVSESSKLAKAGFAESGAALDLLTTVLNAYGMEASKVTDISDMLIQTQNLGKTTVGELAGAMGRVIPTAKANNVQFDQLSAAYSILTAKGIATAETTTYLNAMLNELGKGGTKVDKVLRSQTGKSFSQLSADGKSLSDVLAIIKDNADKSGVSFGDLWSSTEAGKAAMSLLGDGAEIFNNRLVEMNNSAGSTQTAFEKLDTSSNKAKKALNQIKNTGIELGSTILVMLQPAIETAAEKIKALTSWFGNLSDGQKRAVVVTGAVVAAIPPLLVGIGSLCTAVGTIVGLIGAPALLAVAGTIATITAATIGALSATDKESEALKKLSSETEALNKRMGELKAASDEQCSASIAQMHNIQSLKDELIKLADESGNVKDADKGRASFILGELNNALGTEYTMTGNQIERYGELKQSIEDLIAVKTAEAILASKREAYDEAVKNMEKSKKAVDELGEKYRDTKKEYENFCHDYKKNLENASAADVIRLKGKKNLLSQEVDESKKAYDKAKAVHADYVSAYENYQNMAADIANGNAKKIVDAFEKSAGLSSKYGKETGQNYVDGIKKADPTAAANTLATKSESVLTYAFDAKGAAFNRIGNSIQEGIAGGLVNMNPLLKTRLEGMAEKVEHTLRGPTGLAVNSPSKKTIPIGEGVTEGVIKGVKNKEKQLKKALEEQAKAAVETYSNFQKAYSDYAGIALSRYNIWTYENSNATEAEQTQAQLLELRAEAENMNEIVWQANNRLYTMIQLYGESSKEGREALVEYTKQLEKLKKTTSEIYELENKRKTLFSQSRYDLADSKYNLWESENPEASETEKLTAQKEKLTAQYDEQGKKVQDVNDALWEEIQRSGENSDASIELQKQLNNEKAAYNDLAKAIREVNEEKKKAEESARIAYARYYSSYAGSLREMGVSDSDIDAAARKSSGYGGTNFNVNNYIYGATADSAYEVSKKTEETVRNIEMEGLL